MSRRPISPAEGQARLRSAYEALQQGHPDAALAITTALLDRAGIDPLVFQIHAGALSALGRHAEALPHARKAVREAPRDLAALIRLLAVLDALHMFDEVISQIDLALSRGADGPTLRLLQARALVGVGREDEGHHALTLAATGSPDFFEAQQALAELTWSRTGDADKALEQVNVALKSLPTAARLHIIKADILRYAGRERDAYDSLVRALAQPGADPLLHMTAAQMAGPLDPDLAAFHAEAALAAGGEQIAVLFTLCEARLAQGRAEEAEALARRLLETTPNDQHLLAILGTAKRLQGAPAADYAATVRAYQIEPPPGWSDLPSFLADLSVSLERLHTTTAHPVGQSVRDGTQTVQNLLTSDDPAIRGLFKALDAPIRAHIAALGSGRGSLTERNLGGYAYAGVWSVRLKAGGGRHADHVHPQGWLSSAFYVSVPTAAQGDDRAGWIRFGQPGLPTKPGLEAEHFVRPEPGRLVLFPSYMWHGVTPFSGEEPRLTVAFDLVPAKTFPTFA